MNMSALKFWGGSAVLAAVCFAAGRLSMVMALIEKDTLVSTSPLWLPMGIGVGALLLFGVRYWPGIWVGQVLVSVTTGIPLVLAASVAAGSMAAMLVSASLLRRFFGFPTPIGRIDSALAFILIAVFLGPAISATLGMLLLVFYGIVGWQGFGGAWWVFWMGDAVGVAILAPFVLVWGLQRRPASFSERSIEMTALLVLFLFAGLLMSTGATPQLLSGVADYLFFPLAVWAALRFYQHGAVTATLAISAFLVWQATHGVGTLAREAIVADIVKLDGFLFLISTTGLLIGASSAEYERSLAAVGESERKHRSLFTEMVQGALYLDKDGTILDANPAALKILGRTIEHIKDRTFQGAGCVLVGQDGAEIADSAHPVALALTTGEPVLNRVLGVVRPVGNECAWVNVNVIPQFKENEETPFRISMTLEDITQRKAHESLLELNAARYEKAQAMGRVGNWEYDVGAEAFWGSREALRMFGLNPEADAHSVEDVESVIAERERVHSALEELLEQGKPYNIQYEIFPHDASRRRVIHSVAELEKDDLGKPVKIVGVVQDITRRKALESELIDSREKLRQLAAHLQNLREEDRIAIAREIHDDLGQTLSALKMDLGWLDKRLTPGQEKMASKIKEMKALIDQSIQSVKRLCSELRPGILDDLGLAEALEWHADQFAERSGIRCHLDIDSRGVDFGTGLSTTLFRIVQESLTNVGRHAKAQNVWISMKAGPESLLLTIRDDGTQVYRAESDGAQSFGIIGMRERAYSHDGHFKITGEAGKGTRVEVSLPLPHAMNAAG